MSHRELTVPENGASDRLPGSGFDWRSGRVSVVVGSIIAILVIAIALIGPLVYPASPTTQDLAMRLQPPVGFGGTWQFPLGTDQLGRNLLARVIAGARLSLAISAAAIMACAVIGAVIGIASGSTKGFPTGVVGWLVDLVAVLPFIVVAIATATVIGQGIPNVLFVLVFTGWVVFARVIRLQTQVIRQSPYVEASRAMGSTDLWRLRHHVLPGLVPILVVIASQQVAAMILYEGALNFLGLGVGGKWVTWGGMAADGVDAVVRAPWVVIVPGVAIGLTVLAANLVADAIVPPARV